MSTDPTRHPRPLLRRDWRSLDGPWGFSLDAPDRIDREIQVPFAPETAASGVGEQVVERCWYERTIDVEAARPGERILVHFGAVDRCATVTAGGAVVGCHEGGYGAFAVDVTDHVVRGRARLGVACVDDPGDLDAPRGKQDWQTPPHAIWYPRTTGIWRTVWLERVPETRLAAVDATGDPSSLDLTAEVRIEGPWRDDLRVRLRATCDGRLLAEDTAWLTGPQQVQRVRLGDGGVDAAALLWWPHRPVLVDLTVELLDGDDHVLDEVESYTALRSVTVDDGRFLLNGRTCPLWLVLDQGYWPATGATPPDTDALRRDVELTKALGFNGVRKHQKVEDPRYLAWADRLGLLVWAEMPSAYRFSTTAARRLLREWSEVVVALRGHPSVVAWVPLNESWGVGDLRDPRQRGLLAALSHLTDALDGSRPVSANDGWETSGGSIVGIHDYSQDPAELARRYEDRAAIEALLVGRRHDGLLADLDREPLGDRLAVLSEFGGLALQAGTGDDWGYASASSPEDFLHRYAQLWSAVHASTGLAGACYTQLTDTYQEVNGLLRADRTPKVDLHELAAATFGIAPTT